MDSVVDLAFKVISTGPIPADHGYAVYGALSRVVTEIHEHRQVGIHPIRGTQIGQRQLSLTDRSRLIIRTPTDRIPALIALSGKSLHVGAAQVRIGVPEVWQLRPAASLRSRLVTIKLPDELSEAACLAGARQQLSDLNVSAQVIVTPGKRRTLRIKDKEVVGYELILEGLSADESLDVQQRGIGGRRKMGCGVFVPRSTEATQ